MTLLVALLFGGSFLLGYFTCQRVNKYVNLDSKCQKILKNHKDVSNWLKSEISQAKIATKGKNIDQRKVKLLELIIKKLNK